jgi:hypothetical protein
MSERANSFLWFAYIVAIAAAILVCGCGPIPVPPPIAAGSFIAKTEAYIDAAKPHADAEGKTLLDSATENAQKAGGELTNTAKLLVDQGGIIAAQKSKLDDYHGRWIGDATWRAVRWIIGIYLALQVGAILLGGLLPGGIGGGIARFVFNLLPGSNPFIAVARKISSGSFLPQTK